MLYVGLLADAKCRREALASSYRHRPRERAPIALLRIVALETGRPRLLHLMPLLARHTIMIAIKVRRVSRFAFMDRSSASSTGFGTVGIVNERRSRVVSG